MMMEGEMNVERFSFQDKEIVLVGTAHISRKSIELVKQTIEEEKPDVIGIELDSQRFEQLTAEKKWKEMDIIRVIREGKTYLLLINILLANIQRRFGEKVGIKPGMEMMEAVKIAEERKIPIELLDRDIRITLKRALSETRLWEKIKLIFSIIWGIFSEEEELTEEDIEKLKQKDMMSELMRELSEKMPSISKVLIDERDLYIANKILQAKGDKIVAVIGAGHLDGVKKYLEKEEKEKDISNLLTIPKKRNYLAYLKFLIPALFIIILAAGFYLKGIETTLNILLIWILINGGLSALGTLLARGHPFSILTAFVAAPLTSLHPMVAAGWFAGLVEAKIHCPKVKDFESLGELNSYRDFSKNRVTHTLLVVAFANVGSMIGTIIALPYILTLLG